MYVVMRVVCVCMSAKRAVYMYVCMRFACVQQCPMHVYMCAVLVLHLEYIYLYMYFNAWVSLTMYDERTQIKQQW